MAVGPTVFTGTQTQVIYVAASIAAAAPGANTVTVNFSATVPFMDVRIVEYSGLDPSVAGGRYCGHDWHRHDQQLRNGDHDPCLRPDLCSQLRHLRHQLPPGTVL